ncbi:MAG: PD40 domain-containing protein [Armatimonadetes bacterium]|nr:PD40 domain-containing protein [Armatimonadota bacterium]
MLIAAILLLHAAEPAKPVADIAGETHLSNVRQLTFGGQNAEAYWNVKGDKFCFQARYPGYPDEQIFTLPISGGTPTLISTGKGRCTCSYYLPGDKEIIFSSTHATQPGPQPPVDYSKGYVWMVNPNYAMYKAKPDGSGLKPVIVKPGAYVAETTVAPNGKYMVWTSDFEGDLEIYRSNLNGKNVKRLTHEVGYDGGPFVSWDSKKIVYRRDVLDTPEQVEDYKSLLKQHLVRPTHMEIWVMDADGSNKKKLTDLPGASFAPFMHPNGKKIIFSSNWMNPHGRAFELYTIDIDGKNLERITYSNDFNSFAMFTRDGKKIIWASNRYNKEPRETNIFVADWKD